MLSQINPPYSSYIKHNKGEDGGQVNGATQRGDDASEEIEVRICDAPVV